MPSSFPLPVRRPVAGAVALRVMDGRSSRSRTSPTPLVDTEIRMQPADAGDEGQIGGVRTTSARRVGGATGSNPRPRRAGSVRVQDRLGRRSVELNRRYIPGRPASGRIPDCSVAPGQSARSPRVELDSRASYFEHFLAPGDGAGGHDRMRPLRTGHPRLAPRLGMPSAGQACLRPLEEPAGTFT